MRLIALYDADGRILAAAGITDEGTPGPVPVAGEGTEVGTFDVPESLSELPLDEICNRLRVDSQSKRLVDG